VARMRRSPFTVRGCSVVPVCRPLSDHSVSPWRTMKTRGVGIVGGEVGYGGEMVGLEVGGECGAWRYCEDEGEREVNDGRVEDLRDLLRVQEDRGCLRPTVTSAGLTRGYAGSRSRLFRSSTRNQPIIKRSVLGPT